MPLEHLAQPDMLFCYPMVFATPNFFLEATHVFADFLGTTTASDSSTNCDGLRLSPSRACLPSTTDGEASSRSPGSRAGDSLSLPNSLDPVGSVTATSTLIGDTPWPSAHADGVGSREDGGFGARSPGPLTRPPTLRLVSRPTLRKDWTSRGWTPPGVGLAQVVDVYFFCSPTVSCRF